MEEVSVWTQTYKRPEMLRTALRSVAAQTAVKSIREVVVVENGLDERSRAVCAEFSELPITYSIREKSLPPGSKENHDAGIKTLLGLKTRLVAILYDDDWWGPDHIRSSLEMHAKVPGCLASYCTGLWTEGESGHLLALHGDYISWFAAGGRRTGDYWVLGLPEIFVASQIATPFHYSSLVLDRDAYVACLNATGHENSYDTDRLLAVELGFRGKMVCDPTPGVYLRTHAMAESRRLEHSGEAMRLFRHSTNRILEQASAHGINLREEFAVRMQSTSASFEHIRHISHMQNVDFLIQKGVLDAALLGGSKHWSAAGRVLKGITPPVIYGRMAKILGSGH